MEGLQFAQVLADLSELQAADNKAALNLLTCNACIPEKAVVKSAKATRLPEQRPRFDYLGRRITSTPVTTPTVSALQRTNSDVPSGFTNTSAEHSSDDSSDAGVVMASKNTSRNPSGDVAAPGTMIPGTINSQTAAAYSSSTSSENEEKELERARTLMALYKIRGQLKQKESAGLTKAQNRVEAVAQKYAKWEAERREKELKEWQTKHTTDQGSRRKNSHLNV